MPVLAALRSRRDRLAVLVVGLVGWTSAVVGAYVGSRAMLGSGILVAGVTSLTTLKLLMEVHSSANRSKPPTPDPLVGADASHRSTTAPMSPARPNDPTSDGRLELYSDRAIGDDTELVERVRAALIEHHFRTMTLWTDEDGPRRFAVDLDRHSYMRHDAAITYIVPWVNQVLPLRDTSIVEIGCGTGSSTAAFARFARRVHGYDISPSSIAAARVRLDAHGVTDRVDLEVLAPAELLPTVEQRHAAEPVDIVLLFALLEHQTLDERIETLRVAERIVRPGGVIVVTETPNRLTYVDRHTSQLPFFHMLPIELQLLYADRSPRAGFADNIAAHRARQPGDAALKELLIRWGQSVSFHDFEIALGDVNDRVLSSGLHPNLMKLRPERPEEAPLRDFLRTTDVVVHPGFTRYYLDLILAV